MKVQMDAKHHHMDKKKSLIDSVEPNKVWRNDMLPSTLLDIFSYLMCGLSANSLEQLKNSK